MDGEKRVLVTGANGFIGKHVLMQALTQGLRPYAGVRAGADISMINEIDAEIVYLDYADVQQLSSTIDHYKFDFIIHNAGMMRSPSIDALIKVNKDYLVHLVEALRIADHKVKKLLYVSSLAAIGPADKLVSQIVDTSTDPRPVTNYGRSKLLAEQYLREQADIPYLIIRPTAVYGPGEKDLLTVFQMINKGVDLVAGFLPQKLTFIHGEDLASLIVTMTTSAHRHKAYFATDGEVYLGSQFSTLIKKAIGKRVLRIKLPIPLIRTIAYLSEKIGKVSNNYPILNIDKVHEIKARNWSVDITETKRDFAFEPTYTLENGIPATVEWYRKMKWL
jgi:nucleoside-diphosphate-sugar epimerase